MLGDALIPKLMEIGIRDRTDADAAHISWINCHMTAYLSTEFRASRPGSADVDFSTSMYLIAQGRTNFGHTTYRDNIRGLVNPHVGRTCVDITMWC